MAIVPALTYLLGGWLLIRGGVGTGITIGTLVAFIALQSTLIPQTNNLLRVGNQVSSSLALTTRVFEYLDLPVELEEAPDARDLDPAGVRGAIALEHVEFRYGGAGNGVAGSGTATVSPDERPTLADIDLRIQPGEHVALVGATGSGKTTTAYLMARLYDPTRGRVTLDGHDLRELSRATIAACIGLVSQETFLLHSTIAENLRFAAPDATDADLERACRIAQIHDHIASLPDGYATVVGERGHRFSGGEKQRLALARTILRDPPVLILDEATSALDVATERAMSDALETLGRGRTVVSIAHRLSTVAAADRIVVLKQGRIVEQGRYEELLTSGGELAAMVRRAETGADGDEPAGDAGPIR